jgi:hypothetical protein
MSIGSLKKSVTLRSGDPPMRMPKMRLAGLVAMVVGFSVATAISNPGAALAAPISGSVFNDLNGNGSNDGALADR